MAGKVNAYYVDDELIAKLDAVFEKPGRNEIDLSVYSGSGVDIWRM